MTRRVWTEAEEQQLRELYSTHTAAECAEKLVRTASSVSQRVAILGLSKPEGWAAECTRARWAEGRNEGSRASHFGKGHTTWNKGKPGSTGQHPNSKRHHFAKGRAPSQARNYRPIGTLRVNRDGILERKVSDDVKLYPARRWVAVARLVWEETHGDVPTGHAVVFRPGFATTVASEITLDKLELVTRAELMRRNSRHTRYPPEVNQLIQLKGALARKINSRSRKA